jgi:hypothetical protein
MTKRPRQKYKLTLLAIGCVVVIYGLNVLMGDSSTHLASSFENTLLCDIRWWMQMMPFGATYDPKFDIDYPPDECIGETVARAALHT